MSMVSLSWPKAPGFWGTALASTAQGRWEGAVGCTTAWDSEIFAALFGSAGGPQGREARSGREGNTQLQPD